MNTTKLSSTNNVAFVQRIYKAFARRDIEEIIGSLDRNVEWGEPDNPYNPAGGTRFGHEGFLNWLKIGQASEDILRFEPRQFLANDNCVAVVGFTECQVKNTGKKYETDFIHLVTLKEGKIIKFQEYFDTFSAAEAFKS